MARIRECGMKASLEVYLQTPIRGECGEECPDTSGNMRGEGIGDYLLFAVAYRWISRIVYCGNPCQECNDYVVWILKDFKEKYIWDKPNEPIQNTIQLLYNPNMSVPQENDPE